MTKYLAKIGLEMHCEVSETKSKVFSSSRNEYSSTPNCNVRPYDMGFPGVLPVVNKEAVKMALKASIVLNCSQPKYMYFERKNYYYPDMPKNYQITQETKPIPVGIYGHVEYECNGEEKTIRINNLHLEEDAASQNHLYDTSSIDYNRAGVPLLELVTEPDFHSADEAVAFLEHMRSVYQYLDISEADSKKGQLRCDVNVSIMDASLDENDPSNWGTKVEMKNVNSFGGVRDAINYEIKRQTKAKENGTYDTDVIQQTRRWDEESGTTIAMRSKVNAVDYRYFVDPNIPKYKISNEWLEEIREEIPVLAYDRKKKYMSEYGLNDFDSGILVKDKQISDYFEKVVALGTDPKSAANWVNGMVLSYLNYNEITIKDFYLTEEMLKELIDLIDSKTISSKQGKDVFYKCIEDKKTPKQVVKDEGMMQITDTSEIENVIDGVINENLEQAKTFDPTNPRILDYFVGQVMKKTKGKANPAMSREMLFKKLEDLVK
ncbi:MAG: Asp-tRNA(Asn)/Glu-tRNA(Gln) amidotransferase subunit GatB [Bacilli bacterium]|nr:Asp-tRNA(Asn)/Glu-tRNA(Gln) amidotransferase subunit GatB [Bacilli bacterium]